MLIRAATSTLLVVDIQERLLPAIDDGPALVEYSQWLLRVARALDVPVLASEQYSKGLGPTVAALRDELEPTQILGSWTSRPPPTAPCCARPAATAGSSWFAAAGRTSACCRPCSTCLAVVAKCSSWRRRSARGGRATRRWPWSGCARPGR